MSNLKMTSCPVCDSQNESNALLCNVCGWDLAPYPLTFGGIPESYLEKERAKIKWAKQQWQKLLETERINLANVKILQEHEQQHRLNKQQIQSQQEQLQLQTKLLEQQRSDSQQESKLLMDKLEELTCNLGKVQSTVDRIESDKSILMKQNWLTAKGAVTNSTDSADIQTQTKSLTSDESNESRHVGIGNQLRWLQQLLQDWHDGRQIRFDEVRYAISLANELIESTAQIRKRIDALEFRQNVQKDVTYERQNFEKRLKVKDNLINDLEKQIKDLNKMLLEQSSWGNQPQQLQSLMPKFMRAEQERDNYSKEVKLLRYENAQLYNQQKNWSSNWNT